MMSKTGRAVEAELVLQDFLNAASGKVTAFTRTSGAWLHDLARNTVRELGESELGVLRLRFADDAEALEEIARMVKR
jgi:hypothetical protein